MIHKSFISLCTIEHDIKPKSIIKAKYIANHLLHFVLKNSLLSCRIDIEALINDFLKKFNLNLLNHYKVKIIPTIYITN